MRAVAALVFSRDRAMQVDCAIRSLLLHCEDAHELAISVLYRGSTRVHEAQYESLAREHEGHAWFVPERDFRSDVLSILSPFREARPAARMYAVAAALGRLGFNIDSLANRLWRRSLGTLQRWLAALLTPAVRDDRYVLFIVDDSIFVRPFRIGDATDLLARNAAVLGVSLRLGENTTWSYPQNRAQRLPAFQKTDGSLVVYPWRGADLDFGYPLEVSSSVYRLRDMLSYLAGLPFKDPGELEDRMAFHAVSLAGRRPLLGCYGNSVAFSNPVNVVQTTIPNRAGTSQSYGADDLSERFQRGERILVSAYGGFVPSACHQEVELVFARHGG